ncbi:cytochrome P450 18a1-like [Uloborus diversus]|uniref:cytochrome P450 18a1-like n=1 Tax=Uloborus diversus TaxID=327109 RepID=UPI00240A3E3F|nr:cytochrome P450 18a1-like [Uloborus diversus]
MDYSAILLVVCFMILVAYLVTHSFSGRTPPGPIGLPIVGYIPYMTKKPYLDLMKLSKIYGSIFSIRLGAINVIVLGDYESTKEAFSMDAFIGRPPDSPFDLNKETLETEAFNGLPWIHQRRFSLHMLRDLGFGKSRMEDHIIDEIQELLKCIEKEGTGPIAIRTFLAPSMSNNIGSLVFGRRRQFDDPIRKMLDYSIQEGSKAAGQATWQIFFPWLRKILLFLRIGNLDTVAKTQLEFRSYASKEIEEHEATLNPNNIRDYIDGYLLEIKKRNDPAFCKPVLEDMIGAFFGAGSETVRITTEWLLLVAADMPHVRKKVQNEIDEVVGKDRVPTFADHVSMPYSMAVVMELMRWRTIIPINILRYTIADAELQGFFIPKHSYIIANLWEIHHNPAYWGADAEEFRPERFLSEDGTELLKSKYFIPFSIGKRSCPGEPMARVEVFLYFVSILQKFHLSLPQGVKADYEGVLGIGLTPKSQNICFRKRY